MRLRLAPSFVSVRSNISTPNWPHTRTPEIGSSDASKDIDHIISDLASPYTISLDGSGVPQSKNTEHIQTASPLDPSAADTSSARKEDDTENDEDDLKKISFTNNGINEVLESEQ